MIFCFLAVWTLPLHNLKAQPVIQSFSPASGGVGTLVTIAGNQLTNINFFTIGGTPAVIVSNTGNSIVGLVMPGSSSGKISVTSSTGTSTSQNSFILQSAGIPNTQLGTKLVGSGSMFQSKQGWAVAISADGNTAIAGAYGDNNQQGAAWIFTRSNNSWVQQGSKLIPSDNTGPAEFGISVALSADGNTAMIGGYFDNNRTGAGWIFTRDANNTWSQQGSKLIGSNGLSFSLQGKSVALSADGNTAIMGGSYDNNGVGACWIFTRKGTAWTQQGGKMVGSNYQLISQFGVQQGFSVSLSADGNTAIEGGCEDNNQYGACWVFTRTGNVWTQQGNKLLAGGGLGKTLLGYSVSLSADGNTAIAGAVGENGGQGAVWVFSRQGNTWAQQGNKLVGTDSTNPIYINSALEGNSVSISADGNTAIIGGYGEDSTIGAAWIFSRINGNWVQQGNKIVGSGYSGYASQGSSVAISSDGLTALIGGFQDSAYTGAIWCFIKNPVRISFSKTDPSCNQQNGIISVNASNGYAPYTYTIDSIHYQPTPLFTNLSPGNYTVSAKDANGLINSVSITLFNICLTVNLTTTQETCGSKNGSITALSFGGTSPYQYSLDGIHFQNSNRFIGLDSGIYTVFTKDATALMGVANDTLVNFSGPLISAITTSPATCYNTGGTIHISNKGGSLPLQYSIDGLLYQNSPSFSGDSAGIYIASIKDINGCMVFDTLALTKYPTPVISLPNQLSACSGKSLVLNAGAGFSTYSWNTGATDSSILATTEGKYYITATDIHACTVSDTILFSFQPLPVFSLGNDTSVCQNQPVTLQTTVSGKYIWQDGSSQNQVLAKTPGLYWLEVNNNGCVYRDSITISYIPLPVLQLPADTILCDQSTLLLNAAQPGNGASYLWQNGSGTAYFLVTKPGKYIVSVAQNGCKNTDTSIVAYQQTPRQNNSVDTSKCRNDQLLLDLSAYNANYLWQDLTNSPVYTVNTAGLYYCTISNFCGKITDSFSVADKVCDCVMNVPNIFSPNGDGVNDDFRPSISCIPTYYHILIFTRDGQTVFESTNLSEYWKGTYKNNPLPIGTYYYIVKVKSASDPALRVKSGSILLLR